MPSLPVQSNSNIFEVLKDLSIFDENGKLKKEKDEVWSKAVLLLDKMAKHNLYIYVQQNRHSIQTKLRNNHGVIESTNSKMSMTEEKEPIESFKILNDLHSMKFSVSFNAVIRKITSRPFSILYSLPEQLDLWSDLNRYCTSRTFLIILSDFVQNVSILKTTSSNILLFALATEVNNKTVLLYQAISEENRISFINFFLRECLRNKYKAPSEFIVGYSQSLFDTVSKVFNECPLDEYNESCLKYIMKKTTFLPCVLIRVHTIDLLIYVSKWDCLQNPSKKKFVLCNLIYLSFINDLSMFKVTILDLLILFTSKFENSTTEKCRSN